MGGGGVVENHVQHDTHASFFCFLYQVLQILHGTEGGIDFSIVCHIVAVVIHRGDKNRSEPEVINPQLLQIAQSAGDPSDIAKTIAIGIHKGFHINLIDDLVVKIHQESSLLLFFRNTSVSGPFLCL